MVTQGVHEPEQRVAREPSYVAVVKGAMMGVHSLLGKPRAGCGTVLQGSKTELYQYARQVKRECRDRKEWQHNTQHR